MTDDANTTDPGEMSTLPNEDVDYSADPVPSGTAPIDLQAEDEATATTDADETAAGPAEDADPGNDSPITTAAVE